MSSVSWTPAHARLRPLHLVSSRWAAMQPSRTRGWCGFLRGQGREKKECRPPIAPPVHRRGSKIIIGALRKHGNGSTVSAKCGDSGEKKSKHYAKPSHVIVAETFDVAKCSCFAIAPPVFAQHTLILPLRPPTCLAWSRLAGRSKDRPLSGVTQSHLRQLGPGGSRALIIMRKMLIAAYTTVS